MIVATSGFFLRLLSFSFVAASLLILISAGLRDIIANVMRWIIVNMFGEDSLPTRLRRSGIESINLRDDYAPSWEWMKELKNRWRGMAQATAAGMLILLLGVGLISGYAGAWFGITSAEAEHKDVNYPYRTIGCTEEDKAKCNPSEFVRVLDISGNRVHLAHNNLDELSPDFWLRMCPGHPKLPFDAGDVLIYFTYEDRLDQRCSALGPHWGLAIQRNKDGLTDSEVAHGERQE